MNTVWSDYVQSIGTLYFSRKLRFADAFRAQYDAGETQWDTETAVVQVVRGVKTALNEYEQEEPK